ALLASTATTDVPLFFLLFFFFPAAPPTELSTLSLHDALPICSSAVTLPVRERAARSSRARASPSTLSSFALRMTGTRSPFSVSRSESTRLNSSHLVISYAVFCLKKKKKKNQLQTDSIPR